MLPQTQMGARKYHLLARQKIYLLIIQMSRYQQNPYFLSALLIQPADYVKAKSSLKIDVHSGQPGKP